MFKPQAQKLMFLKEHRDDYFHVVTQHLELYEEMLLDYREKISGLKNGFQRIIHRIYDNYTKRLLNNMQQSLKGYEDIEDRIIDSFKDQNEEHKNFDKFFEFSQKEAHSYFDCVSDVCKDVDFKAIDSEMETMFESYFKDNISRARANPLELYSSFIEKKGQKKQTFNYVESQRLGDALLSTRLDSEKLKLALNEKIEFDLPVEKIEGINMPHMKVISPTHFVAASDSKFVLYEYKKDKNPFSNNFGELKFKKCFESKKIEEGEGTEDKEQPQFNVFSKLCKHKGKEYLFAGTKSGVPSFFLIFRKLFAMKWTSSSTETLTGSATSGASRHQAPWAPTRSLASCSTWTRAC